MMDVRVKRMDPLTRLGVSSVAGGSGGRAGDAFKEQLGNQLKEDYKKHINELFNKLHELAETVLSRIDLSIFEQYRSQLKELLQEAIKNAYILKNEYVTDINGHRRVFESIHIIDTKLDDLAKDILLENSDKLDYINRVDEIRGLIMDMLL